MFGFCIGWAFGEMLGKQLFYTPGFFEEVNKPALRGLNQYLGKRKMCPIKRVAGISVKEIFQMKYRRETERIARKSLHQIGMTNVDFLKSFLLVLHASPFVSQVRKHLHLLGKKFSAHGVDLSLLSPIMNAMDMGRSSCCQTISNEGRPLNGCGLLGEQASLDYSICMQEAEIGGLNLPGLVLTRALQFCKVNREKGPINKTMDHVIYQFA